ncbi:GerMN domain-containing protein [Psychrobacter sp. Ps7]|uniref:GerMN domain-containing protein n=1 Tax=Psychrobacter sp. Ps7 TaxID=2790961 RepID=UPI001EDFD4FD|nr:GerMN domain-containing protein [Psychrobacter sp. Ps7]MCG3871793.1 hypothetical protein [Psychrobacter sp. Ps7]
MKNNIYRILLTILSITLAGCSNAENKNQSVLPQTNKEDIFLDKLKMQSLKTSKPQLKCAQFNLDNIDNTVCTYWKDSEKFEKEIKIQEYEIYPSLIEVHELSPTEYNFFTTTNMYYKNKSYEANIFPNSRVQLSNGNEVINLICNKDSCSKPFLWGFATESTIRDNPKLADAMMTKISSIYTYNYKSYLNKMSKQSIKDKLAVKVYFINPNIDDYVYVIRHVDKDSPLKNTIQEYLNGLTPEEKKLGFESSNFGNENFTVKIENHIAKIHFTANDLTKDLRSPQQVIDFTMAITLTAEQFDAVNDAQICVNNTYNYEITFFANEESVDCPF